MRKVIRLVSLIMLAMGLTACASQSDRAEDEQKSNVEMDRAVEYSTEQEDAKATGDSASGSGELAAQDSQLNVSERMVSYEANISVEVKELDAALSAIEQKTKATGGYVVESSVYSIDDHSKGANLAVRVPQKQFQDVLAFIEKESEKTVDRNVRGEDVTEEFVDLDSRLRAKKAVEKRLLSFMETAQKTEDLLKISNDLARVQEEIEQLTGRMNYLKNRTDYASIHVDLREKAAPKLAEKEDLDTWGKAKSTFIETLNGLVSLVSALVVFFVGFSPVLILLGIVGIGFWTFYKRKRKRGDGNS